MPERHPKHIILSTTGPQLPRFPASKHPGHTPRYCAGPGASQYTTPTQEAAILIACVLASAAALAWVYLLTLHGAYWRTSQRLPPQGPADHPPPRVTAVIPARNEAVVLPECLPSLLGQDYRGQFSVVLVDDDSTDGTGTLAAELAAAAGGAELIVVTARPTPPGWAGKVWAMSEGVRAAGDAEYLLFTDADIGYAPGTLTRLAGAAAGGRYDLVSQMALLASASPAARLLIPSFVYFFAQLYPFRRVSSSRSKTAAAAGGCMLARAETVAKAGGLAQIKSARIDDVAFGRLLKRTGGRCWLGLTTDVVSIRRYDRLADVWDMVARSAYTQLGYSLAATAGCVLALAWLYLLAPAAAVTGLGLLAAGASAGTATWLAAVGLAGWLLMTVSYAPILRFYRLSPLRAPSLPLVAGLYAAMTADSARRYLAGRGGEWKGRVITSETA
jgi:hopene-associated glycosyltransferase HpnB